MKKPKIHLICNAHLDPVWQWRWDEGCAEAISTFRNAVELIHEHHSFIFNHNESLLYSWVKRYDPELFKEIKKLVSKGRWFISGGWYLQPDINLIGTEAIIRHISEGRKFFRDEMNVSPLVAYNFDSFGHSGGLPQILRLSGYKMYIHFRPTKEEMEIPSDLYLWKGIDGTEILAYRAIVGWYNSQREPVNSIMDRLPMAAERALETNRDIALFWGLGNHGGGATRRDLQIIDEYISKEKRVEVIHSTTDYFYHSVKNYIKEIPVVEGELLRCNTGCYTSMSKIKLQSLKSHSLMYQTEALRTASWWIFNQKYPVAELNDALQDILFNDFHDILPGSSVEPVEKDVLDQYGKAITTLQRERMLAAACYNFSKHLKTPYIPITILNKNSFLTKFPVELECMADYAPIPDKIFKFRLFDLEGNEIVYQKEKAEPNLPLDDWRIKISFYAELQQIGSVNYKIEPSEEIVEYKSLDSMIKHKINKDSGLIDELLNSEGFNILKGELFKGIVIEDIDDSWGTMIWNYKKILGKFNVLSKPEVIEHGPIRKITETAHSYNKSKIIYRTIAYSQLPLIEYKIRINWHEEFKRLKLSLPTQLKNPKLLCEVPGGIIERPANGEEYYQNRWLIIKGDLNGIETAIGIINNGQYSIDFQDGEARITILRSVEYCHYKEIPLGNPDTIKLMDQGILDISLLVLAGTPEEVLSNITSYAEWNSAPPMVLAHLPFGQINKREKSTDLSQGKNSLLAIDNSNIGILSCRPSGDKRSIIVRLQENIGLSTKTKLRFNYPSSSKILSFKPFEIKTLRVDRKGKISESELISEI